MNSFYGQMRWGEKFEQFFYEFRLTNKLFSDKNTFNENPSVDGGRPTVKTNEYRIWIQPNKDFALFDINAANHWLKLVPLDSKGDAIEYKTNAGFSIYHNSPDVDNGVKLPIFELLNSKPSGTIESLQSGGYFKITNPKFDQAGHFTGKNETENSYFQLPKQIIRINSIKDLSLKKSDQKFHFLEHQDAAAGDDGTNNNLIQLILNSNQDELTFEHKKYFTKDSTKTMFKFLNDEKGTKHETERLLQPGDYISTQKCVYDAAGHLKSIENVYYQLPKSEMDDRVEALEARVTTLETELVLLKSDLKDLTKDVNDLASIGARIGNKTSFEDLYGSVTTFTQGQFRLDKNTYSVADALKAVTDKVNQENNELSALLSYISNFLRIQFPSSYSPPSS